MTSRTWEVDAAPSSGNYQMREDWSLDDSSDVTNRIEKDSTGSTIYDHVHDYTNSPSGDQGDGRLHQVKAIDSGASVAGPEFRYNANGNLYSDGNFIYVFDAWNRLVEVWQDADNSRTINGGDVKLIGYSYNAFGFQCATAYADFTGTAGANAIAGKSQYQGFGGNRPCEYGQLELNLGAVREKNSGQVWTDTWLPGLGGTIKPVGGSTAYWPITDGMGNVSA